MVGDAQDWSVKSEITGKTCLEATFDNFKSIVDDDHILIITVEKCLAGLRKKFPNFPEKNIIVEPASRGTATCILTASHKILKKVGDAIIIAVPSDLFIIGNDFASTIREAVNYVRKSSVVVTIGVEPDSPETSFGYIQVYGGKCATRTTRPAKIKTFTEKPSLEMASTFVNSGEFFWNTGIYVSSASGFCSEIEQYLPDIACQFSGWEDALETPEEQDFMLKAYAECPKMSIDCGVMERTDKSWVFPARFRIVPV